MYNARSEKEDEDAAFDKLPGFFRALQAMNERTVAEIAVDDGRFSMAFMCPGPLAEAFTHCPKLKSFVTHERACWKYSIFVIEGRNERGVEP